jgi:hypothetical protein
MNRGDTTRCEKFLEKRSQSNGLSKFLRNEILSVGANSQSKDLDDFDENFISFKKKKKKMITVYSDYRKN